jgi:hypothetical protein
VAPVEAAGRAVESLFHEARSVWNSPVPGRPTVVRTPRRLKVFLNPRGPTDRLGPDRERFTVTPGAIFMRRKKRQLIVVA